MTLTKARLGCLLVSCGRLLHVNPCPIIHPPVDPRTVTSPCVRFQQQIMNGSSRACSNILLVRIDAIPIEGTLLKFGSCVVNAGFSRLSWCVARRRTRGPLSTVPRQLFCAGHEAGNPQPEDRRDEAAGCIRRGRTNRYHDAACVLQSTRTIRIGPCIARTLAAAAAAAQLQHWHAWGQ